MLALVLFTATLLITGLNSSGAPLPVKSPIPAPVLVTLGDSITAGLHGSYPNKLGALIGAASVTNLGIPGEFSGPVDYQIPRGVRMIHGGVLADEVDKIPLNATIVTLYVGTNDMWLARLKSQRDLINIETVYASAAKAYDANVRRIVAGIKRRVPLARIVIADVPNASNRRVHMIEKPVMRLADSSLAESMRESVIATGATFVDLECDPAMYNDANFGNAYDVHPVESGYRAIAADFADAILHGSTPKPCAYETPIAPQP